MRGVCFVPPLETPGRAHQPPCPMPPCTGRAALPVPAANAQQGVGGTPWGGGYRPVRCGSGRHHSAACICLTPGALLALHVRCPATDCCCYCRVWELFMMGMLRCQARTHWGRDEAAGSDDLFAASWLPIYLLFLERPVAVREPLLNVRGGFVMTLTAYVVPDLPCLAAGVIALSLLKVRPCSGRSGSRKDAVLAGRSFLGLPSMLAREPGLCENSRTNGEDSLSFSFSQAPVGSLDAGPTRTPVRALVLLGLAFRLG